MLSTGEEEDEDNYDGVLSSSPTTGQQYPEGAQVGHWCALMSDDDEEGVMEDISEVIPREFLNCTLCSEEFHNPKLLPCLHSFCLQCLQNYLAKHHRGNDTQAQPSLLSFPCPECGTVVEGVGDAEGLPDNVLARRLSCPSLDSTPRHTAHCATCLQQARREVTARVHCANCDENLCHSCAHTHALQVETSSHKVEPLSTKEKDSNRGDDTTNTHNKPTSTDTDDDTDASSAVARMDSVNSSGALAKCCECYDSYDVDSLYCVDCELALCTNCQEGHDAKHRCADLSAIADNFTKKIAEPIEDLRKDSQTLGRLTANLDRAQKYAGKLQRDVQTKIRRRTRVLCGLIRDYESVLLQEVEKRHQHNMAAIHTKRRSVSQHAAAISAVTELTDKLLQFGSEEEKVALRRKVGRRVRELCEADLPSTPLELTHLRLHEPTVTVETIWDLFGELRADSVHPGVRRRPLSSSVSVDSAAKPSDSPEDNMTELTELEEEEEGEGGSNSAENSMLSSSDRSEIFQSEKRKAERNSQERRRRHSDTSPHPPRPKAHNPSINGLGKGMSLDKDFLLDPTSLPSGGGGGGEDRGADNSNSSFQSSGSAQESVPVQLLERPLKELMLPDIIARDNIKGMGVNSAGDIIIATMAATKAADKSAIYILEQHGIVRGQLPVSGQWNVLCVAADGRVTLVIARGDNRYKVKVVSEERTGAMLADLHLDSLGLNFTTATANGHLLVASNRYTKLNSLGEKAAKSGGNVAIYDKDGRLEKRLTNDNLPHSGAQLLEKPHWLAVDSRNNIFVADSAAHCVMGFSWSGDLLFQLGNSDMEDLYQGPDTVCVDRYQHVIVSDKKEKRIDIVNYQGSLLKSLFPSVPIKFVCATPDKLLVILPAEGSIKFYEYLTTDLLETPQDSGNVSRDKTTKEIRGNSPRVGGGQGGVGNHQGRREIL